MSILTRAYGFLANFFSSGQPFQLTFVDFIRRSKAEHWRAALFWLFVTFAMSLLPIIAGVITLKLNNVTIDWLRFIRHGEVPIYCIGLLVTALVLSSRELTKTPFAHRPSFGFFSTFGIILAAVMYGAVTHSTPSSTGALDTTWLVSLSVGVYVYSLALSFVVTFVNHVREHLEYTGEHADIPSKLRAPEQNLKQQFHRLGENDAE